MNFRKILALLTALILAAACLSGCGNKSEGEPVSSGDQQNEQIPDENTTDEESSRPAGLYIDNVKVDDENTVMLTVNGHDIPFDEFRYFYNYYDYSFFSGGDKTVYEENPEAHEYLMEIVESALLENNWGYLLAAKHNVELTAEDNEEIDMHMDEQRAEFDSDEEFEAALEDASLSEDLLRRIIAQQILCNRVYTDVYEPMDDETVKEWLNNNYVRVYHVLVAFDEIAAEEEFTDASDEEIQAEAKRRADELVERINNGESVYDLAQEVAHDPGMVDNTDGYFFTRGEMVEEFEEKSFELAIGEISEPVETYYGYHIIQRLEQDDFINQNWDELRETGTVGILYEDVDNAIENADIVYGEYFDKITYDSIT